MTWLLAGALLSFGLVGYLTGLVLVPLGIALATWAAARHGAGRPWSLIGLGLGPVVLLSGDVTAAEPPTGAVPAFSVGVVLMATGVALVGYLGAVGHRSRRG